MWGIPDSTGVDAIHDRGMALDTTETTITKTRTSKGWHDDPRGEHKLRFHDGTGWTEHTTHFGPVPCAGCRY